MLAAAGVSCGGAPPKAPRSPDAGAKHSLAVEKPPPPRPESAGGAGGSGTNAAGPSGKPRRATLRYNLNGRRFPLPLVRGTVAGTPTWMLVDTGANSHVVAGWLARQVGLPLRKLGDLGSDHAGRTIATFRVDHPQMVIEEWGALEDGPMLATEVPPLIEQLGIGAFISPQRLVAAEGEGVVLDFPASELRAVRYDDAVKKLGRGGSALAPNGGRVCEDDASPIKGLAFVLPATVDGHAVDLLLDTGAQRSDLLLSSASGRALTPKSAANKEQLYAASGKMTSRTVKAANVTVGEWSMSTDVDLIPGAADPFCPRDGVVSMDVLRACVVVLGRRQMAGRCGMRP